MSSVNPFPVMAAVRQPRGLVQLDGLTVSGWIKWMVKSNTFYEADTFEVEFAISVLPATNDANWFSTETETFVEIFAGFPSNPVAPDITELTSLIYGRVDDIHFDPVTRIIRLTGRDLTAALIDQKITSDYANKRASDVAMALATEHGLTPVVTATSELIGTYYQHDRVRMQANRSEWDLLAFMAREEGFVCFVAGHELHFEADPLPSSTPYAIQWQAPTTDAASPVANAVDLSFSRSQTISKGVSVTVRSASLKNKTAVVQSYPTAPKSITPGKASPFGATQNYYFTMPPGQDPIKVQQFAEQKYREIVAHEMKLRAALPGDVTLTTKTLVSVSGTGTAFDQTYYPRLITREMSIDEGFKMTVEAQNQNVDTAATSAPPEENPGDD